MAFPPEYKDPDSVLIRGIDWTDALSEGDTIQSSQWFGEAGITVQDLGVSGFVTQCKVSGGTASETYKATNRVTTGAGEILDLSLTFIVQELAPFGRWANCTPPETKLA